MGSSISNGITVVRDLSQVGMLIAANSGHKRIAPSSYFSRLFFEKGPGGEAQRVPEEIRAAKKFHTATGFMIGKQGKSIGERVETPFTFNGMSKVLVGYPKDSSLVDTMEVFEHGGQEGESLVQLINAKYYQRGKAEQAGQITTMEQLGEADEIILHVIGAISNFKIRDREGQPFELFLDVGGEIRRFELTGGDSEVSEVIGRNPPSPKCGLFGQGDNNYTGIFAPVGAAIGFIQRIYDATGNHEAIRCIVANGSLDDSAGVVLLENGKQI